MELAGYDISKWAVRAAARRSQAIAWAVASNRQPPVAPASIDLILSLFGFPHWPSFAAILTPHGRVLSPHLMLCTSAHDRRLFPPLGRAMLPVATYIGVTEPLGERVDAAIATRSAIADTRRAGDYYRVIEGGRILWGGRITTRGAEAQFQQALELSVISATELQLWKRAQALRRKVIAVDDFDMNFGKAASTGTGQEAWQPQVTQIRAASM